jgi:hypothetical protein
MDSLQLITELVIQIIIVKHVRRTSYRVYRLSLGAINFRVAQLKVSKIVYQLFQWIKESRSQVVHTIAALPTTSTAGPINIQEFNKIFNKTIIVLREAISTLTCPL